MRVIDVDSHVHEPLDWIASVDAALADELGPPARFAEIAGSIFAARPAGFVPAAKRAADPWHGVAPGFVQHLLQTDELQPDERQQEAFRPFYDAEARLAFCDERGIDVQFLNPTFLVNPVVQAARLGRLDLLPRVRDAWNRWSAEQVQGHTDRLIPVTQIDLNDVDRSIRTMRRMRELGSRAFAIPEAPVRSLGPRPDGHSQLDRSISHPDFEPIWDAAEDLGMAAFVHVGFSRERIKPGWANNGSGDLTTFAVLNMLVGSQIAPQLLLAALAFDGVLERHPDLVVVVEEVGIDWLPHLVSGLELSIGRTPEVMHDGQVRPSNLVPGASYRLPLTPVEYLQRQVRVTPLPATHPIRPVIDAIPHELLCFSSDYPHVEGSASAVELCERQLAGTSDEVRASFFGGVGELLGV